MPEKATTDTDRDDIVSRMKRYYTRNNSQKNDPSKSTEVLTDLIKSNSTIASNQDTKDSTVLRVQRFFTANGGLNA